ncbi:unnamed protein product [Somion occarium]|uniref:Uncharacterized protein n=1 Tax=Somion occarium TaxID=3059160 RepID=A0ABP1CN28_9APHY
MSSIAPTVASLNDRLLNPRNREGAWLWTKEQAFNYILNMHRVAKSKSRQLGYSGADAPQFEDVNNLMDNVIWRALRAELGEQVIANESTTESPEGEPQSINVTSFIGRTILIGDLWNALVIRQIRTFVPRFGFFSNLHVFAS